MQNVSGETFDAVTVRKSLSKLSDFQSDTASPYRVLHQAQGDKQEINPIWLKSAAKTNGSTQRNDAPLQRKMGLSGFLFSHLLPGLEQLAGYCLSRKPPE